MSVVIIALGCSLLHLEKLIITANDMDLSFRSCLTGHVIVPLLDVSGCSCCDLSACQVVVSGTSLRNKPVMLGCVV